VTVPRRPSAACSSAAAEKRVPHVIGPNLGVLLCDINLGLCSAAIRHHFGRPVNRF
jgi:TDG/mug DNA glycosylase family protein